jgi:Kef-type K+ transport system membrane component KefB
LNEVLTAFPSIALALLACLILAKLSLGIGVPRVSIYLLVGVALGPHGLMPFFGDAPWVERVFLGEASHHLFELVTPVAVGFILFRVGGEFQFRSLRQFGPRILALSGFEILSTGHPRRRGGLGRYGRLRARAHRAGARDLDGAFGDAADLA